MIPIGASSLAVAQGEVRREGLISIIGQGAYTGDAPLPDHMRYAQAELPGPAVYQPPPGHLSAMARLRTALVDRAGLPPADAAMLALSLVSRGVVDVEEAVRAAADKQAQLNMAERPNA
jgi:hypothetical protein